MRMIVSIIVNLYTVRLLWEVLGIDNYGIYNLVGGIVMMFAFINSGMVSASQRFISFELGKGIKERLYKVFTISVKVHTLLAIIIFILAESLGLWFLNAKLNIPAGREFAANCVYQCSVISFMLTVVSVPYNACIVAHEHMRIYGYLGILDVFVKLMIVYMVYFLTFDKLISYAVLIVANAVFMRIVYILYCKKHFEECHIRKYKDHNLMRDMFSFAGWSFLGNMGFTVRDQGMNIILNLFFNVAVNAAKGIANQVGQVINGFASNFTMAVNPQITKRYASNDLPGMIQLLFNGCKFSFLLMSIVTVPLIVSAETVLRLWLKDVAPYTVGFLQLVLLMSLIDCVVSPITTSLQATGRIRKFQIIISIIMVANLPLSWILLKLDQNPYMVMFVAITTSIVALCTRLMLLHELVRFSYRQFFIKVYARTLPCIAAAFATSWFIYTVMPKDLSGLILFAVISVTTLLSLIYIIALTTSERSMIISQIKKRFHI